MGAWGPGAFQNDTALDWMHEIQAIHEVFLALSAVVEAPLDAYLGTGECCRALAAAELVAAVAAPGGQAVPEVAAALLVPLRPRCDDDTRLLARRCVDRIASKSELQELFDEGGRYEEWHKTMHDLASRLSL